MMSCMPQLKLQRSVGAPVLSAKGTAMGYSRAICLQVMVFVNPYFLATSATWPLPEINTGLSPRAGTSCLKGVWERTTC